MSLPPGPSLAPVPGDPEPEPDPSSDIPMWLVLALVGVLIAAVGLTGYVLLDQRKDDTEAAGPSYPKTWDPRVAPYVEKVEELRGRTFVHPVTVRFLPEEEFKKDRTADEDELDEKDRRKLEQYAGLLRAIGLVKGDLDLFDASNDISSSGTLAYYSFDDERITIRGEKLTPSIRSTLVHELTHALQDQLFNVGDRIEKVSERDEDSRDRTDALLETLVEGDAERVETLYREGLGPKQRKALDEGRQSETDEATNDLEDVPKFLLTVFSADYTLGEALIQVVAEDGGNSGLDDLLLHTPTNDAALLDPFDVLSGDDEVTEVDDPDLEAGEKKIDSSDFGPLTWYFMLAERLPLLDALAVVDGWGGDASVAFERDGTTCARIGYTGDSPGDTAAMYAALQRWIAAAPGAPSKVDLQGNLVTFESCDPGTAAKVGKDASDEAVALIANRAYLGLGIMRAGTSAPYAHCMSRRLVETFPVERLNDPGFGKDDPAIQARVQRLIAACR